MSDFADNCRDIETVTQFARHVHWAIIDLMSDHPKALSGLNYGDGSSVFAALSWLEEHAGALAHDHRLEGWRIPELKR